MDTGQTTGRDGLRRGMPAALMAGALTVAALAGGAGRAAAAAGTSPAVAGDISTVAGGPGGPDRGTNVSLAEPCGVSYSGGAVYIANGLSVQRLNTGTGWLTHVAGTGFSGPAGNGGPATAATVNPTCDAVVDQHGDLVIADMGTSQIRVVAHSTGWHYQRHMTAGDIYAVAGTGQDGYSGSGGLAIKSKLNDPASVAVDSAGNLVISDELNFRIEVVAEQTGTFYGQAMTAGHLYTVAGNGTKGYSGDGGPATGAELFEVDGIAIDGAGNLVLADSQNNRVRVVAEQTGTFYGQAMTAGDIYTVAGNGTRGYSGDGGPATSAELDQPTGVTVDGAGNLAIADTFNSVVRVVAVTTGTFYGQAMTAGDIYTVAGNGTNGYSGDGGPATAAQFNGPPGVTIDGAGNLVIADDGNARVRVVAAQAGTFYGRAMTAGDVYTVAGNGEASSSGNSGPATAAEFGDLSGVALSPSAGLVIADSGSYRVRVVAAQTGTFFGQAMKAGDVYGIAGNGKRSRPALGHGATGTPVVPAGVAVDGTGNVLIADALNNRILVVPDTSGTFYGQAMTAGHVYSIAGTGRLGHHGGGGPATAATLDGPEGLAVDAAGNVLIADTGNSWVRVVAEQTGTFYGRAMTAGDIYKIAGGTKPRPGYTGTGRVANGAKLAYPDDVTVDGAGNVLIADTRNQRIRVIAEQAGTFYGQAMTAGDIYTIAGDGGFGGFSGDGGPATAAAFNYPGGVAVDATGNVLISDTSNNRVRVVAEQTGTFYGVPMTAGDVYTAAGTGVNGFSGNGGPATSADLGAPMGITVSPAGALIFCDYYNHQIREVAG
jgi:trimeric autotransporter adhesin